jgi:hypothetical protein
MQVAVKGLALAVGLAVVLDVGHAVACDEVSDVTGYRRCGWFGSRWDESPGGREALAQRVRGPSIRPLPLFVETAAVAQTVDAGSVTFNDTASNGHSFSLHNPSLGTAVVFGVDFRLGVRFAGPFYAGLTTRFAFGGLAERTTGVVDGARVDLGSGLGVVALGGVLGVARPLSSRVRIRIEAAVGLEDVGLLAVGGIDCTQSPCGPDSPRAFVEPKVIVDLVVGPRWAVSPFAGDDVLQPSNVAVGVMAAWSWQGFGAPR